MNQFHLDLTYLQSLIRTAQSQVPTQEKVVDPLAKIIHVALIAACTVFVWHGNERWTGSGFHIGDGLIATASHVVPPELMHAEAQVGVSFELGQIIPARIVASDPEIDSGLLLCAAVADTIPKVLLGDSSEAMIGDQITVISSPEGWQDTATAGRISNIHQNMGPQAPTPAWNDLIFIDADIQQGSSGGMVLGTDGLAYGSVMGVTGQHADIGIGQRSVCPSNKIMALVEQYKHHASHNKSFK